MKEIEKGYDDTRCPSCDSDKIETERDISGWAFTTECLECGEKSFYIENDMMGGALNYYHLIETGKEYKEQGRKSKVMNILLECEEGWENKNGKFYEKYDRLKHTANNLIKKGVLKL